jgi:glycosyltransferase involved in cell wall biosynthesis
VRWATRGCRPGEEDALTGERVERIFYPLTDGRRRRTGRSWQALKGVEHLVGLNRLCQLADREAVDLVHFQWAALPGFDRRAIARIRRACPVVLTVHDTQPFNGKAVSRLQTDGYDALLRSVSHLIVHGEAGRTNLIDRGVAPDRVSVVPHGILPLAAVDPEPRHQPGRWRIVLFGKMQDYKGIDVLIDAMAILPPGDRQRIDLVIAGEPMIDLDPVYAKARALGFAHAIEFRPRRLGEREMAALLHSADAFVFPYRAIEASGVLHLVADLGRWIVASDLGAFRELVTPQAGALVPPGDAGALARALVDAIGRRPSAAPTGDVPGWTEIGARTRAVYDQAIARHHAQALFEDAA